MSFYYDYKLTLLEIHSGVTSAYFVSKIWPQIESYIGQGGDRISEQCSSCSLCAVWLCDWLNILENEPLFIMWSENLFELLLIVDNHVLSNSLLLHRVSSLSVLQSICILVSHPN